MVQGPHDIMKTVDRGIVATIEAKNWIINGKELAVLQGGNQSMDDDTI